jgi:hypothetical protein
MKSFTLLCAMSLSLLVVNSQVRADTTSDLANLVASDVVAIGYVDLHELSRLNIGLLTSGQGSAPLLPAGVGDAIQQRAQEMSEAGVARVYVLLRVADIMYKQPIVIFTGTDQNIARLRQAVQTQLANLAPLGLPQPLQVKGSVLVAGASEAHLADFNAAIDRGTTETDLTQLVSQTSGALAGLMVIGDRESRRVVRETFPQLPAPFTSLDGKVIADDLAWCHVAIYAREAPRMEIEVKTLNPTTAKAIGEAAKTGVELLQPQLARAMPTVELPNDLIQPTVTDDGVKILIAQTAQGRSFLAGVVGSQIMATRGAAWRAQRLNQVKQLVLAMLNYESHHGTMIQHASYDASGRPLLSWRVHLLPYLDEDQLYQEFRLDEAWDSPHNRKLIERMPVAVFGDPDPEIQAAVGVGRTTWVVPVGSETAFPPREALPNGEPLKLRDIKDGTSNTIAIVQTLPERAVIWTKPDDWNVDLANPLDGVISPDREGWVAARCDGSAAFYAASETPAEYWRTLLTRAASDLFEGKP